MKTITKNYLLVILLITGLLIVSPSLAQNSLIPLDEWEMQVIRELRYYEQHLELSGQTHHVHFGMIVSEDSEFVTVTLQEGTYFILGVCDQDCSDLDLEIYSNEVLLDSDIEIDAYPLISVSPFHETTYLIKVIMVSCNADPCRYGLAIYSNK